MVCARDDERGGWSALEHLRKVPGAFGSLPHLADGMSNLVREDESSASRGEWTRAGGKPASGLHEVEEVNAARAVTSHNDAAIRNHRNGIHRRVQCKQAFDLSAFHIPHPKRPVGG